MLKQLQAILEAEAAARDQFEAAREESGALLRAAEAEARQLVRAAREARETVARAVEEQIVATAQQEASRLLEEANTVAAAMREGAQPRIAQAVEAIVQCVLGSEDDHGR